MTCHSCTQPPNLAPRKLAGQVVHAVCRLERLFPGCALEEKPSIRSRLPLQTSANTKGFDLTVEWRIRNLILGEPPDVADECLALGGVRLSALLGDELQDL